MIDEEATFERFGYYSTDLKPRSNKKIVAVCDNCGKIRYYSKDNYKCLCKSCSAKQNQKLPPTQFINEDDRFVPNTRIDRILTIEKFGYDPADLSCESNRKIISVCKICGNHREIFCSGYRDLCKSCAGKTDESRIIHSCIAQGINRNEFDGFVSNSQYCQKFDEPCREHNRDKYNRECFICGKPEEDNGQKLSVHHIDMNKNQGCDSEWKLVPLCRSCHSKSHNKIFESRLEYLIGDNYVLGRSN